MPSTNLVLDRKVANLIRSRDNADLERSKLFVSEVLPIIGAILFTEHSKEKILINRSVQDQHIQRQQTLQKEKFNLSDVN